MQEGRGVLCIVGQHLYKMSAKRSMAVYPQCHNRICFGTGKIDNHQFHEMHGHFNECNAASVDESCTTELWRKTTRRGNRYYVPDMCRARSIETGFGTVRSLSILRWLHCPISATRLPMAHLWYNDSGGFAAALRRYVQDNHVASFSNIRTYVLIFA